MWERDYSQKRAEGTEVLLTAKKRVDIVQASECSRLVIGGGTWELLPTAESSKIWVHCSRYPQEILSRFHFHPGSIPAPIQRWLAPE